MVVGLPGDVKVDIFFKVDKTHVLENSCRMPLNGGNFQTATGSGSFFSSLPLNYQGFKEKPPRSPVIFFSKTSTKNIIHPQSLRWFT